MTHRAVLAPHPAHRPQPRWPPAHSCTATAATSTGLAAPGTPGRTSHFGLDNDNADNPFIQPPGVTAKQHMDNTDVLFGRANDDLLIGKLGGDTLLGGEDDDILVGGPEKAATPNSDVLIGEEGDDINIWAPGDGSDAFIGNEGKDTMIFAPFVEKSNGDLLLTWYKRPQGARASRSTTRPPSAARSSRCRPLAEARLRSSWSASTSTATPS